SPWRRAGTRWRNWRRPSRIYCSPTCPTRHRCWAGGSSLVCSQPLGGGPTMRALLFLVASLLPIVVVFCVLARRQRAAFEEQFPPISEQEFVARCRPGTD